METVRQLHRTSLLVKLLTFHDSRVLFVPFLRGIQTPDENILFSYNPRVFGGSVGDVPNHISPGCEVSKMKSPGRRATLIVW